MRRKAFQAVLTVTAAMSWGGCASHAPPAVPSTTPSAADRSPPREHEDPGVRPLTAPPAETASAREAAFGEDVDGPDARINRLVHAGKLWSAVRWFHPYIFHKAIDWDHALVVALPKINAAKSTEEYVAAVSGMLAALGDPLTHVVQKDEPSQDRSSEEERSGRASVGPLFDEKGGTLVVTPPPRSLNHEELSSLRTALLKAKSVVFDLRTPTLAAQNAVRGLLDGVAASLPSRPCRGRGSRAIVHHGFVGQPDPIAPMYTTAFVERPGASFLPPKDGVAKRVAFIVNKNSVASPIVLALQSVGDGVVVSEGALTEENLPENQTTLPLGEGRAVVLRKTELLTRDPVRADVEVHAPHGRAERDVALETALALARKPRTAPRRVAQPNEESFVPRDDIYAEMPYPALEYRMLALFRAWSVIRWFYPYQHLFDRNWDTVLREFIPKLEAARDATEYGLAMTELGAQIPDAHVTVHGSRELDDWFGEAKPPLYLRMIEGKAVVAGLLDPSASQAGVAVGDVVVEVDGVPIASRLDRFRKYTAASDAAHRDFGALHSVLSGPRGSIAEIAVKDAGEQIKICKLTRSSGSPWSHRRSGDIVRRIGDAIAYVDLDRLERTDVDAMFEKIRGTKGVIFDMRGYPNGTAWSIAPRLNTREVTKLATYYLPVVTTEVIRGQRESLYFTDPALVDRRWKYTGRSVMLIDETTISQAEHTGLFFEAVAGTKFIGRATQGANGDITQIALPGGLHFIFTGLDVRHADGRQLQRTGLVPDVEVRPTIAGIRAGRDEVLERAVRYLSE